MRSFASTVVEIAGLATIAAGLFIWFGTGVGLVASGAAAVLVGISLDPPRRR